MDFKLFPCVRNNFSISFFIIIKVLISLSEGYLSSYLEDLPARSKAPLTFIYNTRKQFSAQNSINSNVD